MVRFAGAVLVFAAPDCDSFLTFAHLAFCALAIRERDAADIMRAG